MDSIVLLYYSSAEMYLNGLNGLNGDNSRGTSVTKDKYYELIAQGIVTHSRVQKSH